VSPEKLIGYFRDAGCVLLGLGGIAFQIYLRSPDRVGDGHLHGSAGLHGRHPGVAAEASPFERWWSWAVIGLSAAGIAFVAGIALAAVVAGR
jgi:hypothetical protein